MGLAEDLEAARAAGERDFAAAADLEAVEAVRAAYLGRQGRHKELTKAFKALPPGEKRAVGSLLADVKRDLLAACNRRKVELSRGDGDPPIDVTLPRPERRLGSIHPLSRMGADIEGVFTAMGFDVVDGPHVESEDFNFTRLNVPADHPARDAHDTFWLDNGLLLRTHTSSVQARVYPVEKPPLRKVVIGKVFRYEEVDATHENTFHHVEGFMVDDDINVGHLVAVLKTMITGVLGRDDAELRLRPSFFPFVEPGFELDVRLPGEGGAFADWLELLGCGLVHPRVLEMGGIDSERYSGFAFGMGLDRLAMLRHGIDDIRLFHGADLRGLRQFA